MFSLFAKANLIFQWFFSQFVRVFFLLHLFERRYEIPLPNNSKFIETLSRVYTVNFVIECGHQYRRVSVFNENDYYYHCYSYLRNDGDSPAIMCCKYNFEEFQRIKQITKFRYQTREKVTLVSSFFCMVEILRSLLSSVRSLLGTSTRILPRKFDDF